MNRSVSVQIQLAVKKASNYNKWIYDSISPYVGRRVLDVGCSVGNITKHFLDKERLIGIDVDGEAIRIIKKDFKNKRNFSAEVLDISNKKVLVLKKEKIDTVVSFNVLEHIVDDRKAIKHTYEILQPKGRFVFLVPAHQILFGTMDKADHHVRRYSKKELIDKLEKAGFEVEKQFWFNFPGIFAWFINGKILKVRVASENQYSWYDKLVPVVRTFEQIVKPPVGLSIITICKKL